MHFLNETDKEQLRAAIRAAEARTHGEIVTVIARTSGDYFYYPTLWAALIAMVSPTLLLGLPFELAALGIVEMQLAIFVILVLLLRLPVLKMLFVPKAVQRLHASRRAREQFFVNNLHATRERSGVLLFVSVAERYVELLADAGIHAKVPPGTWDTIVSEFTTQVHAGNVGAGFIKAVNSIGGQLHTYFPAEAGNPNELPDRLTEI